MRALLVYPEFPETFWSFRHALRLARKRSAFPPLGLMTVAAMLPDTWELRLIDMNVQPLTDADLAWADLALVSAMTVQRASVDRVLERCRDAAVRTVAGGPLFTCEAAAYGHVDHLVLDESELTLEPFLDDLAAGRPQRVYRSDEHPSLDTTPTPRWDLIDVRAYGMLGVQFTRGCPFDCEFCNVTSMHGHRPRTKPVDRVLAELDAIVATGWRGPVFFVDDNLIGNRRAVRQLLPALAHWRRGNPDLPLQTQASINLADDDQLVAAMVDAGFRTVFIGIETTDDASLQECNKRQNQRRDMRADIRKLHNAGLQVQAGFIVGFDHDSETTLERQVRFIQAAGVVTAMLGILQAPPGTKLFQRLSRDGRILGDLTGDNVDGTTNIVTRLPLTTLQAGYRTAMQWLYAPGPYRQRLTTFLRDYQPGRRSGSRLAQLRGSIHLTPTLLRALIRLGVLERGRIDFWRLVGWTALRRRTSLPLAISLWAYGHHFRRVARQLA